MSTGSDIDASVGAVEEVAHHAQAEKALGRALAVRICYEASYEGLWLARLLERAMGLETVVLDRPHE